MKPYSQCRLVDDKKEAVDAAFCRPLSEEVRLAALTDVIEMLLYTGSSL